MRHVVRLADVIARTRDSPDCASTAMAMISESGVSTNLKLCLEVADQIRSKLQRMMRGLSGVVESLVLDDAPAGPSCLQVVWVRKQHLNRYPESISMAAAIDPW